MTAIVVLSGLAGLAGTQLLVGTFRDSALRVEREATLNTALRADVVAHSILITSADIDAQQGALDAAQSKIRAEFSEATASHRTAAARDLLAQSRGEWEQIVAAAGSLLSRPGSAENVEALLATPMPLPHVGLFAGSVPCPLPSQPSPADAEPDRHPVR